MSAVFTPQRRLIDVEQFHRMGEAGIIRPEERVELIEGEILTMSPIGSRHAHTVSELTRLLHECLPHEAGVVHGQAPVILSRFSEPQPDLLILRPRDGGYWAATPRPTDVLCLIEVSDTTLVFDRTRKLALYAQAGICEVWILDIQGRRLHLHREASDTGYTKALTLQPDSAAAPASLPSLNLPWSKALGDPDDGQD